MNDQVFMEIPWILHAQSCKKMLYLKSQIYLWVGLYMHSSLKSQGSTESALGEAICYSYLLGVACSPPCANSFLLVIKLWEWQSHLHSTSSLPPTPLALAYEVTDQWPCGSFSLYYVRSHDTKRLHVYTWWCIILSFPVYIPFTLIKTFHNLTHIFQTEISTWLKLH